MQGQRSLEGAVLDFRLIPVDSITVKAAEASGKEYNEAVESKAYSPQELGSPPVQIAKGVINGLANADMGNGQNVRLAQCVVFLLNTALEERPELTGEVFKSFRLKRARFDEQEQTTEYSKLTMAINNPFERKNFKVRLVRPAGGQP